MRGGTILWLAFLQGGLWLVLLQGGLCLRWMLKTLSMAPRAISTFIIPATRCPMANALAFNKAIKKSKSYGNHPPMKCLPSIHSLLGQSIRKDFCLSRPGFASPLVSPSFLVSPYSASSLFTLKCLACFIGKSINKEGMYVLLSCFYLVHLSFEVLAMLYWCCATYVACGRPGQCLLYR